MCWVCVALPDVDVSVSRPYKRTQHVVCLLNVFDRLSMHAKTHFLEARGADRDVHLDPAVLSRWDTKLERVRDPALARLRLGWIDQLPRINPVRNVLAGTELRGCSVIL